MLCTLYLGLRHGGGVSSTPDPASCKPPDCEDQCTTPAEPNYKPHYLGVMNYRYQMNGIQSAGAPGEFVPVDSRLDYSIQLLPTVAVSDASPGVLDELGMDETPTCGLTSGSADLFTCTDAKCLTHSAWPTHGPVDWDGSGIAGDNALTEADLNPEVNPGAACATPSERHRGHVDWGPAPGQSIFRYGFQCTQYFADPFSVATNASATSGSVAAQRTLASEKVPSAPSGRERRGGELTADMARAAHVFYPTRPVQVVIRPGCASKALAPGQYGTVEVALLGAKDLDVSQVDLDSLHFHGATPSATSIRDVNGDGIPDLVLALPMEDVRVRSSAKKAQLEGWLKSSQRFIGEDLVAVAAALDPRASLCNPGETQ